MEIYKLMEIVTKFMIDTILFTFWFIMVITAIKWFIQEVKKLLQSIFPNHKYFKKFTRNEEK